ncbi:PAS domain-containing protein [Geobacter sp. DSM 9736]|uniref:PAS domain-containing sensor histidine kinase n=1 Tax=Geobacter sp. DSM 9736 TaxID=1277350 RepID=UPI000B5102A8|nr:PAS domain-containing protein [Geobacter sp. DSM 9736]SNB46266.1 PAS domain S-box-containing protein [Geobacter sp. DSM 9736]
MKERVRDDVIPDIDFRMFFESVPDPCLILDPDFNILWANPSFFEVTMMTPAESLKRNLFEVFPDNPYDPNAAGVRKFKASLARVLQERRADSVGMVRYDLPITPEKNMFETRFWTPVNVPVFGPDNEITHIILFTKDVTQTIRQKTDAQADLRRILDGIPDIAWMKDGEEKFIWVNKPFAEACGRDVEDLIGKTDMDAWPPELAARYMADDEEVIRSRKRKTVEEPLVSANGEETWIETIKTPAYNDKGEVIGTIGIARDITQRKRAEAALQELNEDFTILLNNTTDFIYLKDQNSRFRFCSQSLAELTGHKDWRDMIGKHDRDVFPAELAKIYMEEETVIFGQGQAVLDKTAPYLDLDGNVRWVNTNKWPIFNSDRSRVIGVFGISRDVTQRKMTEQANQELEAFNYSVAHDLRKPLAVISGYAQIMKQACGDRLQEKCSTYLQSIYDSTLNMNRIIDALLNFANATRFQIHRRTTDLSALAKEVAAELAFAEPDRRVSITIQPGMKAEIDPDLMRVVLGNIIGNAWKFTGKEAEAVIEVGTSDMDGTTAYFVRDNGVGFDQSEAERLFDPFYRLEGGVGGLGIGLATVERIISRHGGRIWAEGEPGKGATFYFTIGK